MNFNELIDAFQYPFMRNMIYAAILASIACGIIGTYVVVRRIVFISGGIAHTTFGGVGLGYYLGFEPMFGAVIFALVSALTIGVGTIKAKLREDSTIGVLWVLGMALGVIFINLAEGYHPDPMSILFGNILLVKSQDLYLMFGLIIVIIFIVFIFYKEFLAMTFDEEYAKISGVRTNALFLTMLCLIALTIVLLIKVVGIVLIIALLTIPAATAGLFTYNMKRMMLIAIIIGIILSISGILISYDYDLPPGATIVVVSCIIFIFAIIIKHLQSYFKTKFIMANRE